MKRIANMAQFFSIAGKLTNSYTRKEGSWPAIRCVQVFEYSDGSRAEHDGKTWEFWGPGE